MSNVSVVFDLSFDISSTPEWLEDRGDCQLNMTNVDLTLQIVPLNKNGRLHLEFVDALVHMEDYQIKVKNY